MDSRCVCRSLITNCYLLSPAFSFVSYKIFDLGTNFFIAVILLYQMFQLTNM